MIEHIQRVGVTFYEKAQAVSKPAAIAVRAGSAYNNQVKRLIFPLAGLSLILLALFAHALGIDNDPGWGKGRALLLAGGMLLVLPTGLTALVGASWFPTRTRDRLRTAGVALRGWAARATHSRALTLALTGLTCAALAAYGLWITSAGRFPKFTAAGGYYPRLAEAFLHGQLHLLEQPDPGLLALPNPYNKVARDESGVRFLWDASLYQGKYYVYWGPVPALIQAAVWAVGGKVPSTAALVACFYIGLIGTLAALLLRARRRYYPRAPGASIALFLLPAGLNLPTLWLVGRPSTYEAAIISGQFFLFLGLLFWLVFMEKNYPAWAALAGLAWGLAVGSRNTLAVSVAVYVVFALLGWLRLSRWSLQRLEWGRLTALALPLATCAAGLAWYNYARFGSLTETGIGYQLTLWVSPKNYFSPVYMPANLYMWLAYPFTVTEEFPFFHFIKTINLQFPAWAPRAQYMMFDREFYSLLPANPILWLLAPGLAMLAWAGRRKRGNSAPAVGGGRAVLAGMIGLAGLAQFALMMGFFYSATRYGAEIALPLILLVTLAAWEADARLTARPAARTGLWVLVGALALLTALIGLCASFYVPEGFLNKYNPAAYAAIAQQGGAAGRYVAGALRLLFR